MKQLHGSARLPDGTALPYVEQGDPRGVPVLLLHAIGESCRSFERLLPLLPSSVRAVAVTQRGHGDADKPRSGYRLGECAQDVADVMSALGLERAVLVGTSSGGLVAQRVAADHPARIRGLVLVGAPWRLKGVPVPPWVDEAESLSDPVPDAFVRESISSFRVGRLLDSDFVEHMVEDGRKCPAHVWRSAMRGLLDAEAPSEGGRISAPTLVLWGDGDEFLTRADEEKLAASIRDAELVVYPGTGHLVLWEEPERVASDLLTFVERLRGTAHPEGGG